MRTATRLATIITGLTAVVTLSACGTLQEASDTAAAVADTANTVQLCTDALSQAAVNVDIAAPQEALDRAHEAGSALADLANDAANTTLSEAIGALAATMTAVTLNDLVSGPAQWLETRAAQVANLTTACT
ncbi:bacteriophage spanin2 family protein [Saccharothrix xinjiangensis]|uniref:Bacteriophage spanin2 family protein n=1 Tax=Saccharothrix xinjiangensis TaxID=204798 RepID=A0ABV9Y5G6_9PSEU